MSKITGMGKRRYSAFNYSCAVWLTVTKLCALTRALMVAMAELHYFKTLTKAERDRKHALMAGTVVGFGANVTAMSVTMALRAWSPRFDAACMLAALMLLVLLFAFEHPVRGLIARLRGSILTRPVKIEAYIDTAPALLLSRAVVTMLRSAAYEAAVAACRLMDSLRVVHIAVLPARVSTALVAPRCQPGAGT